MTDQTVETLSPRAILEKLVSFPTVSKDTNIPLIDWVSDYLSSHGVENFRHDHHKGEPKQGLFAHVGPAIEGGVVLSGHTDVVPVEGQAWDTDPFVLTEKDGKLYGRGSTDMKGFDALAIWAMVEAHKKGISRPLQLALSYDEEVGCTGAAPLIKDMARLPKASSVIVGEPTMLEPVSGHKGGMQIGVHVKGYEIHSSLQKYGVSAIHWAATFIEWINQENERIWATEPPEMHKLFNPPWSNMHVGTIQGGTAHNITAKDCFFKVSIRLMPGADVDGWKKLLADKAAELTAKMQDIHEHAGITLTFGDYHLPPFAPQPGNNVAEELVRQVTGANGAHYVSYGTEASHFQLAGYDCVVCGPGDIAVAHQPNEYLEISQLEAGETFMRKLLEELS